MSVIASFGHPPPQRRFAGDRRSWFRRVPRTLRLLATVALAVALGHQLLPALRSPGHAIRGELAAAAAEVASPAVQPTAAKRRAILRHFRDHAASLDPGSWPQVSVTLHGLDRAICRDAATVARRMEGLVVVELEKFRSAEDCRDDNDMTWRIAP